MKEWTTILPGSTTDILTALLSGQNSSVTFGDNFILICLGKTKTIFSYGIFLIIILNVVNVEVNLINMYVIDYIFSGPNLVGHGSPDVDQSCVFPILASDHRFHSGCEEILNQAETGSYRVILYSY